MWIVLSDEVMIDSLGCVALTIERVSKGRAVICAYMTDVPAMCAVFDDHDEAYRKFENIRDKLLDAQE